MAKVLIPRLLETALLDRELITDHSQFMGREAVISGEGERTKPKFRRGAAGINVNMGGSFGS